MVKQKRSWRIDETIVAGISRLAETDAISESAEAEKLLKRALEATPRNVGQPSDIASDNVNQATLNALSAHIDTLTAEVDMLRGQLTVKDAQIESLTEITTNAQKLHAVTETKLLESGEKKRRGWLARLFGSEEGKE